MKKNPSQQNNASAENSAENYDSDNSEEILANLFPNLVETRVERQIDGKTAYPDEQIARVETAIRTFQKCSGRQAFDSLIDVLNGGTGGMDGLYHEDGNFKQQKIDLEALQLLYGVLRYVETEPEDSARLTYIGYWYYCHEDDNERNFANYPEAYRIDRLKRAITGFDRGKWYRWAQWQHKDGFEDDEPSHWTDDYGEPTYKIAQALIDIGCGERTPEEAARWYEIELPTDLTSIIDRLTPDSDRGEIEAPPILGEDKNERTLSFPKIGGEATDTSYREVRAYQYLPINAVVDAAVEADAMMSGEGRSEDSYKNTIRRLRKAGKLKWAEIKPGVDYRIYLPHLPDPTEAKRIKFDGEEYVPEGAECNPELIEEDSEEELMTDGGTVSVESVAQR